MSKFKTIIYLFLLFFFFFCSKKESVYVKYEDFENLEENKYNFNEIDYLDFENIIIRYYLGRKANRESFAAYDPFNLNFTDEIFEQELEKKMGFIKAFYKDNRVIKYEVYLKPLVLIPFPTTPEGNDNYIYFENDFDLSPQYFNLSSTFYYFYNENDKLIKIISKDNYHFRDVEIEYISDEFAIYKIIREKEVMDEGKIYFDENNNILKYNSTFIR